jgi:ribosomal protein L11 methyltransferase
MKKPSMHWFALEFPVLPQCAEQVSAMLTALGHDTCELREDGANESVVIYHRAPDESAARRHAEDLVRYIGEHISGRPRVEHVPEQTWTESWKEHFPRLHIGSRIEVVPPWEAESGPGEQRLESDDNRERNDEAPNNRIRIVIHPAMAFGTGHHETTHGCLETLDRIVAPSAAAHVLDVGCGTAVLAIAAVKLGAARAVAIDCDPDAVAAARENRVLNGVEGNVEVSLADGPPAVGDEPGFDIVVANIYAETLAAMRDRLVAALKPHGRLVLSGIEATRRSVIEEAFIVDGWETEHLIVEGNWLTFCLHRDFGSEPVERKTD